MLLCESCYLHCLHLWSKSSAKDNKCFACLINASLLLLLTQCKSEVTLLPLFFHADYFPTFAHWCMKLGALLELSMLHEDEPAGLGQGSFWEAQLWPCSRLPFLHSLCSPPACMHPFEGPRCMCVQSLCQLSTWAVTLVWLSEELHNGAFACLSGCEQPQWWNTG